jgi:hypothetical protein
MAFEKKEGSGALFKNNDRQKDTHPEYRGDILINGVEYWLSAWVKEGKNGKFFSLAAKKKEERSGDTVKRNPGKQEEDGTDLPF